jgi:hypothetical protein
MSSIAEESWISESISESISVSTSQVALGPPSSHRSRGSGSGRKQRRKDFSGSKQFKITASIPEEEELIYEGEQSIIDEVLPSSGI